MASRIEQRERARAERLAVEHAAETADSRRRATRLLAGAAALAAVAVAIAIAVSQSGSSTRGAGAGGSVAGATDTARLFAGIPQRGASLGNPHARVTVIEFADLQCPYCREYSLQTMPSVIARYVRTGRVRMEFRPVDFIGPDSDKAARAAAAAARQNRLWQFIDLFYRNQGTENSGYVTGRFLRKIAAATPGLNAASALSQLRSPAVGAVLRRTADQAQAFNVSATPTFMLASNGGPPRLLSAGAPSASQFAQVLDRTLATG